jgi:hypothetical protein
MTDATLVDSLETRVDVALSFADLDAQLRLKIRSTLGLFFPRLYAHFARDIDVAALRRKSIASVITAVDFERTLTPLPVGGVVDVRTSIRLCDLSAGTDAEGRRRLGYEARFELRAVPGTGDPLRYREAVAGAEPIVCASGRVLFTMLRPTAPLIQRLITEVPPEVAHLAVHPLDRPHPSTESLSEVPGGFTELARRDRSEPPRLWGLHHTDVNQSVFTGDYVEALEDAFTELVHGSGQDVAAHQITRAALVFKKPFPAGSRAAVDAVVQRSGDRTLMIAGLHGFGSDGGVEPRPSLSARFDGHLGVTRGDPRFAA